MRRGAAGVLVLLLLVLIGVGALAWLFRGDIPRWMNRSERSVTEVSPEAAAQAEAKLDALRTRGDTVRLSSIEIASLARYRYSGWIPDALREPTLSLAGDSLLIEGLVPTEELPAVAELDRVRAFLPDTARVEVSGRLLPLDPGQAAIEVSQISVSRVPIPRRLYPDLLRRIGGGNAAGLPPNAIAFGLPEGVGSAWVEDGFLVLVP
ncbi:hypothetical protein BH24GEM3_BH24GEM3_17220 [soil metagenome]|jgi:hypothetical protein